MERYNLNYFTLFSFHILLFTLFTCNPTATSEDDGVCALIFCGQGTCKNNNASWLGFECECYAGWKKIQIGLLTFPSCLIPDCTIDLQCGNGSPPPPPPSTPLPPPPLNLTNPCNLIWCANGTCMPNGTTHTCQCNEGSSNLANNAQLPCFQQCYFGADCHDLGFGPPVSSTPSSNDSNGMPPPSPLPPSTLNSGGNGFSEVTSSLRSLGGLTMILLAATLLTLL